MDVVNSVASNQLAELNFVFGIAKTSIFGLGLVVEAGFNFLERIFFMSCISFKNLCSVNWVNAAEPGLNFLQAIGGHLVADLARQG